MAASLDAVEASGLPGPARRELTSMLVGNLVHDASRRHAELLPDPAHRHRRQPTRLTPSSSERPRSEPTQPPATTTESAGDHMAPRSGRGKVRGNGDGALYSQARDRWIGIASIPDPAAKDGRRRIKVSGKDKATAKRKLDEALGKIKQGVPVGPARETVAEALRY